MPVMIQLRNVPDEVHRTLKSRAARAGMSLSDYLQKEIRRVAELPTIDELTDRIRNRTAVKTRTSAARLIRQMRGR